VAEIDTDGPGYRRIVIRPHPGGGPTHSPASYRSIQGNIVCAWRLDRGRFYLEATVPPNTTATVYVPVGAPHEVVVEGGDPAANTEGVELLRMEDGAAVFRVAAGSYRFEAAFRV
jgi:alpha-L-rhamnosidase